MKTYPRLMSLCLACALTEAHAVHAQPHAPNNTQAHAEHAPARSHDGSIDQALELTLDGALHLARTRAPMVLAARARIDVAAGDVTAASIRQPFNPELAVAAGPRRGADNTTLDLEVELNQRLELGGRRQARIDAATAGVAAAKAQADDAQRRLSAEVAAAFVRALAAEERVKIARDSAELAKELGRVAEARHQAGDVGVLDVHAARMAQARANAHAERIAAERIAAEGELRLLLGLPAKTPLVLRGSLGERRHGVDALGALLAKAKSRPELRAMDAELRQAEAQERLGNKHAWPEVELSLHYGREEDANIAMGGVRVSLPVLERGQGLRATSQAHARVLRIERDAAQAAIATDLEVAFAVYQALASAKDAFEAQALPSLAESLRMAQKSYEAGNIPMSELLVLQRELIDARMAYVDLLVDMALAGIAVGTKAGALP